MDYRLDDFAKWWLHNTLIASSGTASGVAEAQSQGSRYPSLLLLIRFPKPSRAKSIAEFVNRAIFWGHTFKLEMAYCIHQK